MLYGIRLIVINNHKIFLFLVIYFYSCTSFAQESSPFFDKNYAQNPLSESKEIREDKELERNHIQQKKESSSDIEEKSRTLDFKSPEDFVLTSQDVFSDKPGILVNWLGLIVNTQETSNFNLSVSELLLVASQFDLAIGQVYFMGHSQALLKEFKKVGSIVARGGVVKMLETLPEKYQVERSPSWIVSTNKGEFVLDGVLKLNRFFNKKGEFLDPDSNN